jgi:hypothetical protein
MPAPDRSPAGGGVTVAVLSSRPVVPAGTVPLTVNVALVPTAASPAHRCARARGVPHEAPRPLAVQVQVNPAKRAGSASCTRAFVTFDGPVLVTTTV